MKKVLIVFVAFYFVLESCNATNIRDKRHVFTDALERMEDAADRVQHELSRVFQRETRVLLNTKPETQLFNKTLPLQHFSEIADRTSHRLKKTGEDVVRRTADVLERLY